MSAINPDRSTFNEKLYNSIQTRVKELKTNYKEKKNDPQKHKERKQEPRKKIKKTWKREGKLEKRLERKNTYFQIW